MNRMGQPAFALLLAALALSASAREPDFREFQTMQDSLSRVHPRLRAKWMAERGVNLPGYSEPRKPDSTGIRMVGKWGRGPSYEVTGRDSLVFLSLGSEVAIINFATPDSPEVLSEPQAMGLVCQAAVRDSFLYIGTFTGAEGIEIWNISDPRNPVFRNRILTRLADFFIKDSLAFVTQRMDPPSRDTFKVYSLVDPDSPRLVGTCPDSGHAVTVSGNIVIQADWDDVHAIDVSDPANPRRVGSYPGYAVSVAARNTICCAAFQLSQSPPTHRLVVLDIADPATVHPLGTLDDAGAYDIYLTDTLAFLSGFESDFPFRIVSIADSTRPRAIGSFPPPSSRYGVWADLTSALAFVADDYLGLDALDITALGAPVLTSRSLGAHSARDVSVAGSLVFVADNQSGLFILNAADPTRPNTISNYDTTGGMPFAEAVAVADSFAFLSWFAFQSRKLRAVDVTDPADPRFAGHAQQFNPATDLVVRDSFVYAAEPYQFEVYNVARPREPVLVGSCNTQDGVYFGLAVLDTLAFVAGGPSLQVVNVANPANPRVVGSGGRPSSGVAVKDTLAYVPYPYDTLYVYSTANPAQLRMLSATPTSVWPWDVALGDSALYVGAAYGIDVYELRNPAMPRRTGGVTVPNGVRRLHYSGGLLYAALWDAGMAVYETTTVGISERKPASEPSRGRVHAVPSPAGARITLVGAGEGTTVTTFDVAGRTADVQATRTDGRDVELNTAKLRSGVYFVEVTGNAGTEVLRIVKP